MIHRALPGFWSRYHELPKDIRAHADRQFALLTVDPRHPSLHFKKLGLSRGRELWSARATISYRALAIRRKDDFLWIWIGKHDEYDQIIS